MLRVGRLTTAPGAGIDDSRHLGESKSRTRRVKIASHTSASLLFVTVAAVTPDPSYGRAWLKHWLDATPRAQIAESYGRLASLVAEGALGAPVEATYPLEQRRNALAHAARADRTGRVLFTW